MLYAHCYSIEKCHKNNKYKKKAARENTLWFFFNISFASVANQVQYCPVISSAT